MPTLPFLDPAVASPEGTVFEEKAEKGLPNGYAPLDSSAKVPAANLPDQAALDAEVDTKIAAHNAVTAGFHGISDANNIVFFEDLEAEGYELSSNKNIPNGYAGLDAGGKISLSQLPDANATEAEAIGFAIALG